ncbi:HipA family kinase [Aurantimonas sp. E1-2-R+4]|uniref:HipA family kinase n=1 Tax=Aurantimonas sp. E1-2-R+4 TaxID=3113714 RepID=UPI002F9348BE
MKAANNRQGTAALVSELVSAELASWLGLSVPPFSVIHTIDIEIMMERPLEAMEAPLFFSRFVSNAVTRDGTDNLIKKLSRPDDVSRLVIFDTWIRNVDRFDNAGSNSDNLLFAPIKRRYELTPIDHTHCFTDDISGFEVGIARVEWIEDPNVYGLFPEFEPHITALAVDNVLNDLSSLTRVKVEEIVASVPALWGLGPGMSRSLLNFVERRCRVERYAALDAGAMNFSAFWR